MKVGFIGLGKMGKNMVLHMLEQGIDVVIYNRTSAVTDEFLKQTSTATFSGKLIATSTLNDFLQQLSSPHVVWLMVAAGAPIDEVLDQLITFGLKKDDIVIDGGNSFYKDSVRRYDKLAKSGIHYIDCGTSGGLEGGRTGACLMLGGEKAVVDSLTWLWNALSAAQVARPNSGVLQSFADAQAPSVKNPNLSALPAASAAHPSWAYFGPSGAGHFVKMVHNGVEYGMDEALGEGFALLEKSPYALDLAKVADNWNHGSVVRGWLIGLLARALSKEPHLESLTGTVGGGETGRWALEAAKELGVGASVLEEAIEAREKSKEHPNFSTKVVSALRREYGGHEEGK